MDQKLETFLVLCSTMHYGRAAEILNLSQPAVSKHIQSLENRYGVTLFEYTGRKLKKTRQGEILEQYAESLRYNEEDLISQLHEKPKTLLRIGATKSIGKYILLPNIKRFLSESGNKLEFIVDNTTNLLELLNQGKMDFVILEGIFDKRHYDSMLFKKEQYIGICSKKHPFAGKKVPLEKLFKERLFLREEGSGTRKILERELAGEGYSVEVFNDRSCISSFDIIKELVSENHGISFVYEAVVKDDTNIGNFECPPLTGTHDFNIVFLKNTNAYSIAEEFLDIR